jgi:FlaA1/EpsC-like NDP-sugar epimerase
MLLKNRLWFIVSLQLILIFVSLTFAWLLRFEFRLPGFGLVLTAFPILALSRLAAMGCFKLFHGYWRYTGLNDMQDVVKAVVAGSIGFVIAERYLLRVTAFPVSVYVVEAMLTAILLAGVRICSRVAMRGRDDRRSASAKKRALVVGAGSAGAALVSQLPEHGYAAIGLLDDDPTKAKARLHGVPVIGPIERLPELAQQNSIDEILIAIPSATGRQMRRITEYCQQARVRFRTIPALADLIENRVSVEQLRTVKLEDLLGREVVHLDSSPVHDQVMGRVLLVTGAAGSIGSELCAQLLTHFPAKLICVDQDESGLFFLEQRLSQTAMGALAEYHVADVSDQRRMISILRSRNVEIIFHAAAYKHVPMMERNVHEAVRNNVLALVTILEAAEQCGCNSFLLISSDKAVNPTSVMGCTKRIGELILSARPNGSMRCISVRFGNVLGSQGSVVPVLEEQILKHRRVTITHPEITRFFMTIPEAVLLILQALAVGKHREILVLDMGEPMRIVDLARTMIRLLVRAEDEVKFVYTGLREGEKLHEELFYGSEVQLPTQCDKLLHALGGRLKWRVLHRHLQELKIMVHASTEQALRAKLKQIVPEYQCTDHTALPAAKEAPLQPASWEVEPLELPVWEKAPVPPFTDSAATADA